MVNHKLRTERKRRNWSMDRAASEVGVTKATYLAWELGRHRPRGETLDLLCKAFHVPAGDLGYDQYETSDNGSEQAILLRLTPEQVAEVLSLLGLGETIMTDFDPDRRDAILRILKTAGLTTLPVLAKVVTSEPWERLSSAITTSSGMNAATVRHFESLVVDCWGLSNNGELEVAEQVLFKFLPKMMRLAPQHSEVASIAWQGLRLRSVLAAHQLHITDKLNLCQQSVEYAKLANDSNALVAAIIELAVAYKYAGQPEKSLRTYQEALYHIDDRVSPLIQSRAYAAAAAAFAQAKRKREAGFYIGLAHEVFPAHPEQDPVAPLADYGRYMLIYYSGLVHIESNEGKQAWNTFEGVKNLQVVVPERNRLEIVNYQGRAAIQENDLDGYAFCLEDGLASSVMLKSKKRFDEAINIMKRDMPAPWLNDRRIQDIIEKYHLDVAS